jgi:hypothetical protein
MFRAFCRRAISKSIAASNSCVFTRTAYQVPGNNFARHVTFHSSFR